MLACFCLLGGLVQAQDRYAIRYKYKPNTAYSLDQPEAFLTADAIQRRSHEGIPIDSLDLPVSPCNIDQIKPLVKEIIYQSKWMNASVVTATEEQVKLIDKLAIVDTVELVARGFYEEGKRSGGNLLQSNVSIRILSRTSAEEDYAYQNGLIGISEMHQEGLTGEGVKIAVLDGGFMNADKISGLQHLFDNEQIIATKDFVKPWSNDVFRTENHGTAALSLIASNDPENLVSGAYDASYILCITEDVASEYRIEEYNWSRAAEYADSLGTDIISSSLGYRFYDDPRMDYDIEDLDGKTAIISQAANIASSKGIIVITSAGNAGNKTASTISVPADAEGILAIGSVDKNLEASSFSSIGPSADGRIKPDLTTLGRGVWLWHNENGTSTSNGTSYSAPQIAGLVAGIRQGRPEWKKEELLGYLLASGSQAEDPDNYYGYGIPNFHLAYFGQVLDVEKSPEIYQTKIYPNPTDGREFFIQFGAQNNCHYLLYDTQGQIVTKDRLSRQSQKEPYEMEFKRKLSGLYIIELQEGNVRERHKVFIQ